MVSFISVVFLLGGVGLFWKNSGLVATRFARINSRESFAIKTPIFIARQADWPESLGFLLRANHPIRANRANRSARITPLRFRVRWGRAGPQPHLTLPFFIFLVVFVLSFVLQKK